MKRIFVLAAAVCLLSIAAFAQTASYSGTWKLDVSRSTLSGPMRIESMTWTVTQTDKQITVESVTKRLPPNDAPPAGGGGRGGMGRGGFGGGDGTNTFPLDGKEIKSEVDGPMGKMPVAYKGTRGADGSLKLSTARTFNGPNGEMTVTTDEAWSLSADGKTLTVKRSSTTPRGEQTSTFVFTKS